MKTIILNVEYHIVPDADRSCSSSSGVICRFHGARDPKRANACSYPGYNRGADTRMPCMRLNHIYLLEEDMPEHVAGMLRDAV